MMLTTMLLVEGGHDDDRIYRTTNPTCSKCSIGCCSLNSYSDSAGFSNILTLRAACLTHATALVPLAGRIDILFDLPCRSRHGPFPYRCNQTTQEKRAKLNSTLIHTQSSGGRKHFTVNRAIRYDGQCKPFASVAPGPVRFDTITRYPHPVGMESHRSKGKQRVKTGNLQNRKTTTEI